MMAQTELEALTVPNYGDYLNTNSDIVTNRYMAQIEVDALTKVDYYESFNDNYSDMETCTCMAPIELDAQIISDYCESLNNNSDVETSRYMTQIIELFEF